jgi:hypothetical protein
MSSGEENSEEFDSVEEDLGEEEEATEIEEESED